MSAAPLTAAERERIAANIARIKDELPEFIPFFKDLHALGMTTGWRDIDYVGPPRPDPRGAIGADRMVLESAANLKKRMAHGHH